MIGLDEAFVWNGGPDPITLLRPAGISSAAASDINQAGLVVGEMQPSGTGSRAFLHDGNQFFDLGTLPGGNRSRARAINSSRQIVGMWGNSVAGQSLAAFLWQDGLMTNLNTDLGTLNSEAHDINDIGQVVGWMGNSVGTDAHAFI